MRIALFGGTGFIGKEYVRIAPDDCKIKAFNRPHYDLRVPESYEKDLNSFMPDVVINLSAIIGTLLESVSVVEMYLTNTLGSINLAYKAHKAGAKSYIFSSSTVVYGESKKGQFHGRFSQFAPKHAYAASKASAEYGLRQFSNEQKDMAIVTLRPPMVIGGGSKLALPPIQFVQSVLSGKNIEIFGDGLHEREFVSVRDVALGINKAVNWSMGADKDYHPFILSGNRVSMKELAQIVVDRFGGRISYRPKSVQAFSLTTDASETKQILGWEPHDDLDAILVDVARHI